MTIPLNRLYHYIESIAQKICGDDVIIYRFFPHGSKKLKDLSMLKPHKFIDTCIKPQVYCYDQEPLNYDMYTNDTNAYPTEFINKVKKYNVTLQDCNLVINRLHVYDSHILIHSEQRSNNLKKYLNDPQFIPVYYWSHAIIAKDWFRYAKHVHIKKNIQKTFLIYNRAWAGTREYRLKFIDLLVSNKLINECQVTVNPVDPEIGKHYTTYEFTNPQWKPFNCLEKFVTTQSTVDSSASADFCEGDYTKTDIEVVLETLFDDDRLHLTEKILRPIAIGQPFLLVATHGSLAYLRAYGFKTFSDIIDESYDTIVDPIARLNAIVKVMADIAAWDDQLRFEKMNKLHDIAKYNRSHFFSDCFTNQVIDELKFNLTTALNLIESTNTGKRFITRRKNLSKFEELKQIIIHNRQDLVKVLQLARQYYNRQ